MGFVSYIENHLYIDLLLKVQKWFQNATIIALLIPVFLTDLMYNHFCFVHIYCLWHVLRCEAGYLHCEYAIYKSKFIGNKGRITPERVFSTKSFVCSITVSMSFPLLSSWRLVICCLVRMRKFKLESKIIMDYITAERLGRVLIWAWNKYVKKTAIPYKEIDFHYPDWVFLLTGLVFCGIALGIILLYFAFWRT